MSNILSADVYDRPKAKEYEDLMAILRGDVDDAYGHLLSKEARVLDTVDRVVNDARLQSVSSKSILNMSVSTIVSNTATTVLDIYRELYGVKRLRDVRDILTKKGRLLYVGILITVSAMLLLIFRATQ